MNEQTQTVKIGITDQFMLAIARIREYPKLTKQKTGRAVNYAFLVTVLLTCIAYLIPLLGFHISIGSYEQFFRERIPAFALENGQMNMDGKIDMNMGGVRMVVDSNVDKYTTDDLKEDSMLQMLVSKNNILFSEFGETLEVPFQNVSNMKVTNETLVGMIPMIHTAEIITLFMLLIFQFFRYLIGAFGYALLGLSMASMQRISLSFSELFKIGIYGKTLAGIAGAMNETLGYPIGAEYWYSVALCISFFYVSRAIRAYSVSKDKPTDLVE